MARFILLLMGIFLIQAVAVAFKWTKEVCLQGKNRALHEDKCYDFEMYLEYSYSEAQTWCGHKNGSLATVKDEKIQNFLVKEIRETKKFSGQVRIGLKRDDGENWIWEDETPLTKTYSHLKVHISTPFQWIHDRSMNCAVIDTRTNQNWWDIVLCEGTAAKGLYTSKRHFICEYKIETDPAA